MGNFFADNPQAIGILSTGLAGIAGGSIDVQDGLLYAATGIGTAYLQNQQAANLAKQSNLAYAQFQKQLKADQASASKPNDNTQLILIVGGALALVFLLK